MFMQQVVCLYKFKVCEQGIEMYLYLYLVDFILQVDLYLFEQVVINFIKNVLDVL